MPTYASGTEVSTGKSREEIERTLRRYGADEFAYASSRTRAIVGFVAGGRQVRFVLPLPDPMSREFTHTPTRRTPRTAQQAEEAWEQACRQRWRALALIIKAKLEAVQSGIVTFEEEFAMHMVLPDGQRVASVVIPAITEAYETGGMPALTMGT